MDDELIERIAASLPKEEAEQARNAALADRVSSYFIRIEGLKYVGIAGLGTHGGTIIFNDNRADPRRRIVIKYSHSRKADWDLKNERSFLNMFRGSEHIVQRIPLAEVELDIAGQGRRPTIALEYIPNGTLMDFRKRMDESRNRLPSRFLWQVYLCLVRHVIAMAYPSFGLENAPQMRERIRTTDGPYAIMQNSPHSLNIMIGDMSVDIEEHIFIPIFKLIDFGHGRIEADWRETMRKNIFYIGKFIFLSQREVDESYLDMMPQGGYDYAFTHPSTGRRQWIETQAPPFFTRVTNIDIDLRDLIARCMALNEADVPSLEELVMLCENGARKGPQDIHYENDQVDTMQTERDEALRLIVQRFIFDANVIEEEKPEIKWRPRTTHMGTTLLGLNADISRFEAPPEPSQDDVD
ncbi:hypothetical protein F5Y11DRAFT_351920 [Daldinia sp. FL1419]|nr:hypothetical protein F5Y11DRAFT_351920 [Daldinia sp. FL1419]